MSGFSYSGVPDPVTNVPFIQNFEIPGQDTILFENNSAYADLRLDAMDPAGGTLEVGGQILSTSAVIESVINSGSIDQVVFDYPICFCRGTMILTPAGEVAVERLKVGDLVQTLAGVAQPITWIGRGRSLVTTANERSRPIIVRRDALADGVPSRDLHVTKGHSLYLDGVLIPVEFLVNGRSVVWDAAAQVVEFYHLELPGHDVLVANGAPAESYRDDGNRELFPDADGPRYMRADTPHYAPVLTGGPEVDQVWRRMLARTGADAVALTGDADLHLVADGARVEGEAEGLRYRFRLDRVPFELRIRSRVCNPVRLGTQRDPRDLGVALRRLLLRSEGAELALRYDSPWLTEGFNGPEPAEAIRWTTGDGIVPGRALAAFEGPIEVEVELGMTTRYPCPAAAEQDAAPTLRFDRRA